MHSKTTTTLNAETELSSGAESDCVHTEHAIKKLVIR